MTKATPQHLPCEDRRTRLQGYYVPSSAELGLACNTFGKETVVAGIRKHYVDPDNLSLAE